MYKFKEKHMKVPCFVWSETGGIEQSALDQIINASTLPFAFHHTVLCPDAHLGYGAPIGGVLATQGVVIPNFVGVDIGCGMCAVKTSLKELPPGELKNILSKIRQVVPVGFNKHKEAQPENAIPLIGNYETDCFLDEYPIIYREFDNALRSVGSLGGGNHFIEFQKDELGFVWIMLHSGSRNLGYKVADHYNKVAIALNEKWFSSVPKDHELAFLPIGLDEGQAYLREMQYCVDFALANRQLIMQRILEVTPGKTTGAMINIAHNYAVMENHFGQNVMIHRKGATRARVGELGIIPGSQGSNSYIVEGLGNPESFMSCSHGAGRKMGRKQAIRELDLAEEQRKLDDMGVLHSVRGKDSLDEAPGAYKDIESVMDNQKDLVKIITKLTPIAVIKG